jgi:hypothetical protein
LHSQPYIMVLLLRIEHNFHLKFIRLVESLGLDNLLTQNACYFPLWIIFSPASSFFPLECQIDRGWEKTPTIKRQVLFARKLFGKKCNLIDFKTNLKWEFNLLIAKVLIVCQRKIWSSGEFECRIRIWSFSIWLEVKSIRN